MEQDYQGAFDIVPHQKLRKKLDVYGIGEGAVERISHYLSGRTRHISVNGASSSSWRYVTSGIHQGSVIGPLLFVLLINDIPEIVESTLYVFADDTKIFNIIHREDDKLRTLCRGI